MATIYITGHRNPDMDSVCSAWAYAQLKNTVDPRNTYVPIRCGNLNESTKKAFETVGVPAPAFIKDVRTRVSAVMRRGERSIDRNQPVASAVSLFQSDPGAVLITDGGAYCGLMTDKQIENFYLRDASMARPVYHIHVDNIPLVVPGRFLQKGSLTDFTGPIVVGAMKYELFCAHMDALEGANPILVMGDRDRHLDKAVKTNVPCIILTGSEQEIYKSVDFSRYKGTLYLSNVDTSETVRLLRNTVPIGDLLTDKTESVEDTMLFDEARKMLSPGKSHALPVFHEGKYVGFITRRCFLERPRTKVILVDHNEKDQSVPGLEEAEIVEVIDHHRIGPQTTPNPIYFLCNPIGSTCTIIWSLYKQWGVQIPQDAAKILLYGITSDTVALKSPTTTDVDRKAVTELCNIAYVFDYGRFSVDLFSSGSTLEGQDPKAVVKSDFKSYVEANKKFGIGQVEVTTLKDAGEVRELYLKALEEIRAEDGFDFAMLLVTDVIHETSVLYTSGMDEVAEHSLVWEEKGKGSHMFLLPGILSRKKQLLPEILRVLEEA